MISWNSASLLMSSTGCCRTQLNLELRTQVSDISKSASSLYTIINKQYHFVTSSDRFPLPVRSAVKSNFTNLCCQNLSKPHTHTHTRLTALLPGLPGWAGTRKVTPIWICVKQETVSGSGIRWAICKSAPRSRQITTPAPHWWVFYRPDALPAVQPTASKHWRHKPTLLNI